MFNLYSRRVLVSTSFIAATLVVGASQSHAQTLALPKEASERFTLNVKAGLLSPLFPYQSGNSVIGVTTLVVEPSIVLGSSGRTRLILPVEEAQFRDGVLLSASVGLQYDVALPVRNLYLTPRISVGGQIFVGLSEGKTYTNFWPLVEPAIGIKYVVRKHMNLGLDMASFPITFGGCSPVQVDYQLLGYVGVNI